MSNIIIAGPGRSGKTTLARHFINKGFNHYKMDSIKRGIDNNFIDYSIPYWKCSSKMCYLIKTIIDEAKSDLTYNQSLIIDTCHIYPSDVIKYNLDNEIIVFVGYPNILEFNKFMNIRNNDLDNIWTSKLNDQELFEYIKNGILYSKEIENECIKYNLPFFDISCDFDNKLNEIINYINDKIDSKKKIKNDKFL